MKSWDDVAPDAPLTFEINGKTYVLPEIGYRDYLTIQKVQKGDTADLDGMTEAETWRIVLGSAWDDMVADNVPVRALERAGLAAMVFFSTGSREQAETVWEKGVDPKAVTDAAEQLDERKRPSGTGAASGTRRRASTSGTSSRPAGKKTAATRKKASRSRT